MTKAVNWKGPFKCSVFGLGHKVWLVLALSMLLTLSSSVFGQTEKKLRVNILNTVGSGYSLTLESFKIPGFPGLQSFAVGHHDRKWVLIGGRTDGLHRRQPFAAFAPSGNNTNIIVIDPDEGVSWSTSIDSLPAPLNEQLQSTNMQFIQRGTSLYLIGGYGYSKTVRNHVTHDKLTAIKIDCLISAVVKKTAIGPCFRQLADPLFAVTGGQLGRIGDSYFLVGGQKFEGRYNPMGPDHGPGFFQQYTEQIRKFKISDDGQGLRILDPVIVTDKANLHRRDLNMLPQIFANGEPGFTLFSGVFKIGANVPFTNTIDIFADRHVVNTAFTQYLSHYHSAKLALYDAKSQKMENIFFGGISQYEESSGELTRNDDVPFTRVISKVTRSKDGTMTEAKIGEMPGFYGAGAEFLLNPSIPAFENEIVKLSELRSDRVLLGYIVGGIHSSRKSVFFGNSGGESTATDMIHRVWLTKPMGH